MEQDKAQEEQRKDGTQAIIKIIQEQLNLMILQDLFTYSHTCSLKRVPCHAGTIGIQYLNSTKGENMNTDNRVENRVRGNRRDV